MSEPIEEGAPEALETPAVDETPRYLIGVRLREPLLADDYQTTDADLHVGDFVLVETGGASVLGEGRRPKRPGPSFKRDRVYRRGGRGGPPRRGGQGGGGGRALGG